MKGVELEPLASTIFWVAFCFMFVSFLYFYCLFRQQSPGKRLFHGYTTAIVGFASTSYLFMALGYGAVMVDGHIFHYARYLDWLFTTPLLLMDLAGLCRVSMEDTFMLVVLDVLMVLAGLAGGLTSGTSACFLMWLIGCIFFLPILFDLAVTFPSKAKEVGSAAHSVYVKLSVLSVILWILYPIVFIFAEYLHVLSTTGEIFCYGILDVLAKVIFGFILLHSRESLEEVMSGYSAV